MNRTSLIGLVAAGALQLPLPATATDEGFQVELTPYLWMMGVDGDVTVNDRDASFDQSFSDLIDNVDAGFSLLGVLSYNRWLLFGQYDYFDISTNGDDLGDRGVPVPPGGRAKLELETTIGTIAAGYRFGDSDRHAVDLLVGLRDLEIEPTLTFQGEARTSDSTVTDTIVMLRPSLRLSDRWRFNPTLSYAVDGDSDTHFELSPQLQYQFADSFALRFGYRSLNYELSSGSRSTSTTPGNYRKFDGDMSGLLIGVGWTFPKRAEPAPAPAVAAAPAPAPAPPPAPPADSDGDGVPDSADRCPNTPPGSRVDKQGCECDFSVSLAFTFDSAVLNDDDKRVLDQLAERLRNASLAIGTVEGHTDGIGSADYNQALSERRAQAAVDYLAGKGIDRSRATIVGLGKTQPIADNATEAGRAQNRRVVLRRTDCDGN